MTASQARSMPRASTSVTTSTCTLPFSNPWMALRRPSFGISEWRMAVVRVCVMAVRRNRVSLSRLASCMKTSVLGLPRALMVRRRASILRRGSTTTCMCVSVGDMVVCCLICSRASSSALTVHIWGMPQRCCTPSRALGLREAEANKYWEPPSTSLPRCFMIFAMSSAYVSAMSASASSKATISTWCKPKEVPTKVAILPGVPMTSKGFFFFISSFCRAGFAPPINCCTIQSLSSPSKVLAVRRICMLNSWDGEMMRCVGFRLSGRPSSKICNARDNMGNRKTAVLPEPVYE
mmetsp:Transcript_92815/g.160794  ORF Transcript_92815/g.160794 Transcript_92815/m.160794 type:complete len:292 (-) Transcript_92815:669-1544(-)